ncbi:dihydroorotate dehydrogenase electron transfer subunit [Lipingzhangella sp. LS1_29]|uniref:Dihydroorotate dehydrogenase electron transfer subunit n=1 Tax=Lipingzhangella rawalii TaxID=2055835 RepID=A0ABU2H2F1_9ACTN|nr:dihydroorotate dehydrogenase electron transfer subunit [Lipingzhangella rawalii]MDS1269468.1 dihydroorotate dehydrogenase electron transfer subunit [Lipingzhangella rawalii]
MTDFRPVQMRVPVLAARPVDHYHALTVVAPGVAERFRAGQFVAVAVGDDRSGMMLRRPFSIYEVRPDHGGTVEFRFAVRGAGTAWLAERRAQDLVDVVGPLGRPYPLPRDPVNCVLAGEEHGGASLVPLARALRRRGCRVDFVLGASTAARILGGDSAQRLGESLTLTTEDGSLGERARVSDMVQRVVHEAPADVVYAAGPLPLLRAVTAMGTSHGIPVQVSVEQQMTCGTGICMSCVLPVTDADEITRMVRTCVDGPVFRGEQVRFDDVGTIPFDALGAPGWAVAARPQHDREPVDATPSLTGSDREVS